MIRIPLRLIAMIVWLLLCLPPGIAFRKLQREKQLRWMTRVYFCGMSRIIGLRIIVTGEISEKRPLLLVSNHVSYIDIIALGSVAPVIFTPKSDIAGWPVIGFLARLIGSVFIDRNRTRTADNLQAIRNALAAGSMVSLFAEGTTSDGKRLLPFRSAYFHLAEDYIGGEALTIQTASIVYTRVNGLPADHASMPRIAWYGDMDLASHLLKLLRLRTMTVHIDFHPPFPAEHKGRKQLAEKAEKDVLAGITRIRQGK